MHLKDTERTCEKLNDLVIIIIKKKEFGVILPKYVKRVIRTDSRLVQNMPKII